MELVRAGVDEAVVVVVVVLAGKTVVAVVVEPLMVGRPALVGVDIAAVAGVVVVQAFELG